MAKIIKYLFTTVILLTACSETRKQQTDLYLEINNLELSGQIMEYKNYLDSTLSNKPYILRVSCFEINDSTSKYVISSDIQAYSFAMEPYHFKCKLNKTDVYFTMASGIVKSNDYGKTNNNFFKVSQNAIIEDVKKYFPKDYQYYLKYGQYPMNYIYDPELLYLTFIENRLVKKTYKRGLPNDCN